MRHILRLFALLALSTLTLAGCKSTESGEAHESGGDKAASSSDHHDGDHHGDDDDHHGDDDDHHGDDDDHHGDEGQHDEHDKTADHAEGHGRHHDFDKPEEYAKEWNSPERDKWQKPEEVIELMGIESGDTAVDLGTGTGYFLAPLSRAVGPDGTVLALDVSEKMLQYVKNETLSNVPHDNVETRLVERDDPKLQDASVDGIVMVNTWHHVKDRVGYAKKLLAALKPGGKFLDVDYTMETDMGPPKKIRLTPDEVADELKEAGFEVEIADESLPKQYVVVATKPEK